MTLPVVYDRVKETTATTGTGTVTLAGAASGFRSFSVVGNAKKCFYALISGTAWEVGIGTYTSSGTTLSRDVVQASSNSGNKISLSGTSDVFLTDAARLSAPTDYDPRWFGSLDPTGVADCSAVIQAAVDEAETGGGVVKLPPGIFLCDTTLTLPINVSLIGRGKQATTLLSGTATTMLQRGDTAIESYVGTISDLTLDGDSTGTIGLFYKLQHDFNVQRVSSHSFDTACCKLEGSLIGTFRDCNFGHNIGEVTSPIGITAITASLPMPCNFVLLDGCVFSYCTNRAVDWHDAAHVTLRNCDLELNGTSGDDSTGVIVCEGMCPTGEGVGFIIDSCWIERNNGAFGIGLGASAGKCRTIVQNTIQQFAGTGNLKYGIYVDGNGSFNNRVLTSGGVLYDNSVAPIKLDGAQAFWEKGPMFIGGTPDTASGTVLTWGN